jgi:hypothetical protein
MNTTQILKTKHQIPKMVLLSLSLVFGLLAVNFIPAQAATIYLDPPQETIGPNEVVQVKVKIGVSDGECINAAQVGLDFPSDILQLKDFNIGDSFLSLWVQRPDQSSLDKINKEGRITFSGGIPGGYCGVIPGDPGESNILGSLIFVAKKPVIFHKAKIDFNSDTQAFLNDGDGTEVPISSQGSVLQIDEKIASVTDTWAEQLAADNIQPESFVIEIGSSPRIASGKYFLVFSAVDKQTGIDHYEVLEAKAKDLAVDDKNAFQKFLDKVFKIKEPLPPAWVKADSPYILKDQSLNSVIRVKAIDRAGNERLVEYNNAALLSLKNPRQTNWRQLLFIGASVLAFLFVMVPIIVHLRKKARRKTNLS